MGESGEDTSDRGVLSIWMRARSMFSTSGSLFSAASTCCLVSAMDASEEGGRPTVSLCGRPVAGCSLESLSMSRAPRTTAGMSHDGSSEDVLASWPRSGTVRCWACISKSWERSRERESVRGR